MRRVRVIIIHEPEHQGFGAGSPDLLDPEFFLLGSSVAVIEAALPAALEAHCGERVAFEIITRPSYAMAETVSAGCRMCKGERWVCENHKHKAWPAECECGAGAPCPHYNVGNSPETPPDFEPDTNASRVQGK